MPSKALALAVLFMLAMLPVRAEPVTWARLAAGSSGAEAKNWLSSNGDPQGTRYSALDRLTPDNVAGLKLMVSYPMQIGVGELFANNRLSPPLVDDGMLYLNDGYGRVVKFDIRVGSRATLLWSADAAYGQMDAWLAGQWNLTLSGADVVLASGDGVLRWLDTETGTVKRQVQTGDPATGYQLAAPALLVDDTLLVAGAGLDRGAALGLAAYAANNAEPRWQRQLSDPLGVGSVLRSGAYDGDSGLAFWNTAANSELSRPQPITPGNMLLAVDASTGEIRWSHSFAEPGPNGAHSEEASPIVAALPGPDGKVASKVLHLGANGYFYRLNAIDGSVELARNLRPVDSAEFAPGCAEIRAEPGLPITFSKHTGLVYGALDGGVFCPAEPTGFAGQTTLAGRLVAVDPQNGDIVAQRDFPFPLQSGLLSTAGGLVFAVTADGTVRALNDRTLATLWSTQLPSVRAVAPITFETNDGQYLAIISGGGPFYDQLPFRPAAMRGARHVTVLVVYGLGD